MSDLPAPVEHIDAALEATGSDIAGVKALEELAGAAKRFSEHDHDKKLAIVAKWKVARHGGKVLAESKATGQRRGDGQRGKSGSATDPLLPTLDALGISKRRADRWRKAWAMSEAEFDSRLGAIMEDDEDADLGALGSLAHLSAEKDDWATPQDFFDQLDAEFRFDLDVCAKPHNAKTPRYFTKDQDALTQEWAGTCWMNPPYSRIEDFLAKARASAEQNGATVVCLVPSRTDVGWFWDIARAGEVRFIKGRLSFVDDQGKTGPAPFPSCLVIFGRPPRLAWHEH